MYRERIHQAQRYIQNNIHRNVSLEEVAHTACFSTFHFHRLFSIYTGEGVYGYIRRLRLQKAAEKICLIDIPINDVAKEAQYETAASFTKAFTGFFGVSPAAYRQSMRADRREVLFSVNKCAQFDWNRVEPQLLQVDPFDALCIRREGNCLQAGYAAWEELASTVRGMDIEWRSLRKVGITVDTPDIVEDTRVRYDAGVVLVNYTNENRYLFSQQFGGGEYAVFTHRGSYETLWETYLGICLGWLPENGVALRDTFWFDEYLNRPEDVSSDKLVTRIYLTVTS